MWIQYSSVLINISLSDKRNSFPSLERWKMNLICFLRKYWWWFFTNFLFASKVSNDSLRGREQWMTTMKMSETVLIECIFKERKRKRGTKEESKNWLVSVGCVQTVNEKPIEDVVNMLSAYSFFGFLLHSHFASARSTSSVLKWSKTNNGPRELLRNLGSVKPVLTCILHGAARTVA